MTDSTRIALSPRPRPASRTSANWTPPSAVAELPSPISERPTPSPPITRWANSPDSGSIAWGARASMNKRSTSSNSSDESERIKKQNMNGPIYLRRRTVSVDDPSAGQRHTDGRRGSFESFHENNDLVKARFPNISVADFRTAFIEQTAASSSFSTTSEPVDDVMGLFPLGPEVTRPVNSQDSGVPLTPEWSQENVDGGGGWAESPEDSEGRTSLRRSPVSGTPTPPNADAAKRKAGFSEPGLWEEHQSWHSPDRDAADTMRSTSRDHLATAALPHCYPLGTHVADVYGGQIVAFPSRIEAAAVNAADLIHLPGTIDLGEGLAGGPQRDSKGKKIDLNRWRKQDPIYATELTDPTGERRHSSLRDLKKRFSRSMASLGMPGRKSGLEKQASAEPDFVMYDRQDGFADHLPLHVGPDVPQRHSSRRHSLAARRVIDSVGPPPVIRNRYMSASTPDLLAYSGQKAGTSSHGLNTPRVLDWLSEQDNQLKRRSSATFCLDKPLPRVAVPDQSQASVSANPALCERRDSEGMDNVPELHARATSTSSTLHLSTPKCSGSTILPPAQVVGGMRTKRSSVWGLSAFVKSEQVEDTECQTTSPTGKHGRGSSFTRLKHMFTGGRSKPTLSQNSQQTPIERSKSPFARFTFPKAQKDNRKSRNWDSPSGSANEKEEDDFSPVRQRPNRASGDWKVLFTRKGSLRRLTSKSDPDLLSHHQIQSSPLNRDIQGLACPQRPSRRRSVASNDVQQQRRAAEDVEGNFVAMQVSPASPRMNQRPLSYASEFLSVPQRLSRLTEIEEDERSNMDVASIVDAHHPTLAFPASCDPKPEGGDFRLPLDLGSNFNVNSFPLYEYAGVRTPDDFRFPRIGRVSQTSYFQPAALRQLSEHSDKSPSTADLEITFPMPPRPSSPGKLATSKRSFDELSLSAVIGGGMHASPKFESEADAVSMQSATIPDHDRGLAAVRNWSWRSVSGRASPHSYIIETAA